MSQHHVLFPNLPRISCEFSYITNSELHDVEKPYYYSGPLDPDQERSRTNIEYISHGNIPAYDLRGHENLLSIDKNGFEIRSMPTKVDISKPVDREDSIAEEYMEELSAWLKSTLDAELVLCYNLRVGVCLF
jgi:hypothetical protein